MIAGQFDEARLAYEWVIYNASNNQTRTIALMNKSLCYVAQGEFADAQSTTARIQFFGLNDSLHYESRHRSALNAYYNADYTEASSQLLSVDQFLPKELSIHSKPLRALVLNELRQWEKAESELIEWARWQYSNDSVKRDSIITSLQSIYRHKNHPQYRDPRRADLWATILPGTGQLYSGYLFDAAFTALMVASGFGIAAIGVIVVQYYVTGVVLGYAIYQRFYTAGIKRSVFLANKRNYQKSRKYNDCLQSIVLDI